MSYENNVVNFLVNFSGLRVGDHISLLMITCLSVLKPTAITAVKMLIGILLRFMLSDSTSILVCSSYSP